MWQAVNSKNYREKKKTEGNGRAIQATIQQGHTRQGQGEAAPGERHHYEGRALLRGERPLFQPNVVSSQLIIVALSDTERSRMEARQSHVPPFRTSLH